MAVFRDFLETVFRAVGVPAYQAAFTGAAQSAQMLARTQALTTATTTAQASAGMALTTGLGRLATTAALTTGALGALAAVATAAAGPFSNLERSVFRMNLLLRNMGRAAEIPGLDNFNRQMQQMSGNTSQAVAELTALLVQSNFTNDQIRRTVPALIDWSQAVGISLPQSVEILTAALRGERDALQRYGMDVDLAASRTENLDSVLRQIHERFRGGAQAAQGTMFGALQRLHNSFQELLATVGRLFGPALTATMNFLTKSIEGWTMAFQRLVQFLERIGALAPLGDAANRVGTGATGAALRGDPARDTKNLNEIAQNTRQTASAMLRMAHGEQGTAGIRAGNIRTLRQAIRLGA